LIDRKTRSGKVIVATTITMAVLILMAAAVFIAIQPVTVVVGKPATLNIRAPGGYESTVQIFVRMFPDFTATKLHYSNPYLGSWQGPWATLTVNAEYVSAKAADTSLHVAAQMLDFSVGVPLEGVFKWVNIKCKSLEADAAFRTPDADDGEFGTLVAKLKGDVLFHVPNVPGLPKGLEGGYHYEGQSLTLTITFVEPIYTIDTTSELTIAQGCTGSAGVIVAPIEEGITGKVDLGLECRTEGIKGWFEPSQGVPRFSSQMYVNVQPWVPTGTYTAHMFVKDMTTGKSYQSKDIAITVKESGFTIKVNGQDSPVTLSWIPQGTDRTCTINITPWGDYTVGMGLYWRGTSGDFAGIGIEMPGGIPPPPYECPMYIKVSPDVSPGFREMDVCVKDDGLRREFTCHVIFEVVLLPP